MPQALSAQQRAKLLTTLKQRYIELWTDIRSELARADAEAWQKTAGETHDSGDESTADVIVDLNLADIHRDIGEMREISSAIQRVVDGSYGSCSDCGGDIGLERLTAVPTAQRCQHCQLRYEQTHMPATAGRRL